jgi:hypothetical protein
MGSSGSEYVRSFETPTAEKRKAVRVWLLGGFRVGVGSRTITQDSWHLRKAVALATATLTPSAYRLQPATVPACPLRLYRGAATARRGLAASSPLPPLLGHR